MIVGFLVGSVVLLAAFVWIELHREEPLFDLRLMRKPAFLGASLAAFCLSASMFSMFLYLTLYLQGVLDYTPLEAGLRFLPVSLLSFLVGPVEGQLSSACPCAACSAAASRWSASACCSCTASAPATTGPRCWPGSSWPAWESAWSTRRSPPPLSAWWSRDAAAWPPGEHPFRQIGLATGIAGLGAIFQHRVGTLVAAGLAGTPGAGRADQLSAAVSAGAGDRAVANVPAPARDQVAQVAHQAFVGGMNTLLYVTAAVAVVGAIGSTLLVRRRDFVVHGAPAGAAAESPA